MRFISIKPTIAIAALLWAWDLPAADKPEAAYGVASWYGEELRGRLMANGRPFDPDKLTAASWFYPLGTKVRVTILSGNTPKSVVVTITDRGPAERLVRQGRIIDLAESAFRSIADVRLGLITVSVEPIGANDE